MCNRYEGGTLGQIELLFGARPVRAMNDGPAIIHPKDPGLVVRQVASELVIEQMCWGFPVVLRGKQGQPLKPKPVNNTRFDKLAGFWKRWAASPEHRCLIPARRFAEAVGEPGRMTETWLSVTGADLFAWAGIWRASDEWGPCYSGVMTDAAPELQSIHDRCPVILARNDWENWLTAPLTELYRFDRPWPAAQMRVEATDKAWFQRA